MKEIKQLLRRVVFLLDPALITRLRKAAFDRHVSMSSIVRAAVEEYLSNEPRGEKQV